MTLIFADAQALFKKYARARSLVQPFDSGETVVVLEIKDALEKSMAPGSQTFEQALFKHFMEGKITQDEAMANADSPSNMLWLINQATAGEIGRPGAGPCWARWATASEEIAQARPIRWAGERRPARTRLRTC